MNRKSKNINIASILVGVAFIALFAISITIQVIGVKTNVNDNNITTNTNDEASDDWASAFENDERQLVYMGTPSCSWCNKIRPHLDSLKTKYGVDFVYINMSEISGSDRDTIFEQLEIDGDKFGTPYLVIMENGNNVSEQVGYISEEQLFTFYQNNGLINNNEKFK